MAMKRTAKVSAHPTVWPEEIRAAHDAMCSAIVEARSAELKALKLCPRRCWEQTKNKQRVISANARQQAAQEAFKRCAKWATGRDYQGDIAQEGGETSTEVGDAPDQTAGSPGQARGGGPR
jgi:hypothetical protein